MILKNYLNIIFIIIFYYIRPYEFHFLDPLLLHVNPFRFFYVCFEYSMLSLFVSFMFAFFFYLLLILLFIILIA